MMDLATIALAVKTKIKSLKFNHEMNAGEIKKHEKIWGNIFPGLKFDRQEIMAFLARIKNQPSNTKILIAPKITEIAPDYYQAVTKILKCHGRARKNFHNYKAEKLNADYLFLKPRSKKLLKKINHRFRGDFIVLIIQGGRKYAGYCPAQVDKMLAPNEFGLEIFYGTCYLLIHPEAIKSQKDLAFNLPGNIFTPVAQGQPHKTLYYQMLFKNNLELGTYWQGFGSPAFGSLTAYYLKEYEK